ncbi:MAG: hypothetical protein KY439_00155 [Actinobacteria bacterium]|nr:hypothetical protein [Actinomycetota bacterium]
MSPVVATTVPNPLEAVADGIGGVAGGGAGAVGSSVLDAVGDAMARALADAAGRAADGVVQFLTSASGPSFDQGWWAGPRAQSLVTSVGLLAAALMVAFLFLALLQGLLAGEPGAMVRAAVVEVPVSVAATVVLVAVTQLLLGITDGASAMVLEGAPGDLGRFLSGFGQVANVASQGLLGVVLVVVFLVGALLVWVELVVRSSLIYLLVAFAPLTLAARVWPGTRGAFRKLCELGVALIVSKFAIALALGLGAAALAGGGPNDAGVAPGAGMALGGLLTGGSLMLVAAFTPFVVLRLLPVLEGAVVAQGISRSPGRAAQTGMQGAYYADGLKRMAASHRGPVSRGSSSASPPGGGAGPGGAGAPPGPGRPPGGAGRGPGGGPAGAGPGRDSPPPAGAGSRGGAGGAGAGAGAGGAARGATGGAGAGPAAAAVAVPVGVSKAATTRARGVSQTPRGGGTDGAPQWPRPT